MPHERKRAVLPLYQKLIQASPLIGVFGHRHVGKTTFVNQVARGYVTFDNIEKRKIAQEQPELFIQSLRNAPFAIDECQIVPEIFPELKEHVRKNKKPGQFLLTGSVRFTSRKAIRESLAGRMMFFELFPMIISELDERELPDVFNRLLDANEMSEHVHEKLSKNDFNKRQKSIDKYLHNGGLPGICFLREQRLIRERLDDLHRLILDRDMRMVHETKLSLEVLMAYLKIIASFGWRGYSYTEVKKELGLSPVTQKSLLYAFESIFLIRKIPIYGGSKGDIILMEDQLEENLLSKTKWQIKDQLNSLIYRNMRAQFHYRLGNIITIQSYWTRNNARVPLVIKSKENTLGLMVIESEEPTLSELRAAESLLKYETNVKVVFVSYKSNFAKTINKKLIILPIAYVV